MTNPQLDAALARPARRRLRRLAGAASGFGLTDYDARLDDLSADAFRARATRTPPRSSARLDAIGDGRRC